MVALMDGITPAADPVADLESMPGIETLEDLEAPWNWGHFFAGVGTGVAAAGITAGVAAAIT